MRRSSLLIAGVLAAASWLVAAPAAARCGGKGGGRELAPSTPSAPPARNEVVLDEEDDGPVVAGMRSEAAEKAKRLFDEGCWGEAAVALHAVARGTTGDDEGNRQIAQYHLAIALHNLELPWSSLAVFTVIAERRSHLRHREALLWLAVLAEKLPEPAGVARRVGRYSLREIEALRAPDQRASRGLLVWLLGRELYARSDFVESILAFEQLPPDSAVYAKGQLYMGMAYVNLRKTVPAVKAFLRVAKPLQEAVGGEEARLRDLAWLSTARAYYSANEHAWMGENCAPAIDANKLSSGVKYWNRIEATSPYWPEALLEVSWAYFMAGDYPHALGNLATLKSPYFEATAYPEADFLEGIIRYTLCRYDDTITTAARMKLRYEPLARAVDRWMGGVDREGREERYFALYEGGSYEAAIAAFARRALAGRDLRRYVDYARALDGEARRVDALPALGDSALGAELREGLRVERALAVKEAGALVRARLQRERAALQEQLLNAERLLIDVRRAQVDEAKLPPGMQQKDLVVFGQVVPDYEHVIWPFDGEYWRDELGSYRVIVESRCHR